MDLGEEPAEVARQADRAFARALRPRGVELGNLCRCNHRAIDPTKPRLPQNNLVRDDSARRPRAGHGLGLGFLHGEDDRARLLEQGFWHATAASYRPSAPLSEGELSADVAIVGGEFLGLATAHYLLETEPGLRVAVLESEIVECGASGRNGSFAMTVVGLGLDVLVKLKGRERAREAHRYMERAVDTVGRRSPRRASVRLHAAGIPAHGDGGAVSAAPAR